MNDVAQIKEAIAFFETKIREQGMIVNARDLEKLAQLRRLLAELDTNANTNN